MNEIETTERTNANESNQIFVSPQQAPGGGALAAITGNAAVAETLASIYIAKQFPRNLVEVTQRMKESCSRPKLAQVATYAYTRATTTITGPSIRLAEVLVGAWGNMEAGWKVIARRFDPRAGVDVSECVAFAWDKETNIKREIAFSVPHVRDLQGGKKAPLKSERDIYELCANMASRRVRACILQVIPGWLVEEAMERIEKTLKDGDGRPLSDRVRDMLAVYADLGVSKERIEAWLGHPTEQIVIGELVKLGKQYNALRDGVANVQDIFPEPEKTAADVKPASLKTAKKSDVELADSDIFGEAIPGLKGGAK